LHEEGLLEQKYDWYVQHLSIHPDSLAQHEVSQRIQVGVINYRQIQLQVYLEMSMRIGHFMSWWEN